MKIPKRIASAVINSLKGGVVPRIGLPYITVGREQEINALLHDVEIIADGGASFRFIVGKYGSGKSFLLQTIRSYVMDRNFVVVDADLSPERRPGFPQTIPCSGKLWSERSTRSSARSMKWYTDSTLPSC